MYIPADEIACKDREIFIERVDSIENVTPKAGHAYFDADGVLWGYLNHDFVPLNRHPVKWGELQGTLTDQLDLKLQLEKYIQNVVYNGKTLKGESVKIDALTGVKVNGEELTQTDHKVNIDLTSYAKSASIPQDVGELNNDVGYITNAELAEALKDKADKIEADIQYCTDEDIDRIFEE